MDLGEFIEAQQAGEFEVVDVETDKFFAKYRAIYQWLAIIDIKPLLIWPKSFFISN